MENRRKKTPIGKGMFQQEMGRMGSKIEKNNTEHENNKKQDKGKVLRRKRMITKTNKGLEK